jgi:hypothetical protein
MEIRTTSRLVRHPRKMVWLEEDLRATTFVARGEWVNLVGATFTNVDFRGSRFEPFNAQASTFLGCDFTNVKFKTGSLGISQGGVPSTYRDCLFDRADLRGTAPDLARFERCSFRKARIDGWDAFTAEFVDCTFEGRLADIRFTGTTRMSSIDVGRTRNEFHGNDFTGAELVRVEFICGIDLAANRLPDGPGYVHLDRRAERIERARADVARWPDDAEREVALLALRIYSREVYADQPDLFKRRDDVAPRHPAVRARLLELLERPLR